MASNFVSKEAENHDFEHRHNPQKLPSPRGVRRSWSANSSSFGQGSAACAAPKCVCAPPTHARSFKCRLHRTMISQGNSPPSPTSIPPPPSVDSSHTPTVEAQ